MDDPSFGAQMIRQTLQDVLWGELDYLVLDFPPCTALGAIADRVRDACDGREGPIAA